MYVREDKMSRWVNEINLPVKKKKKKKGVQRDKLERSKAKQFRPMEMKIKTKIMVTKVEEGIEKVQSTFTETEQMKSGNIWTQSHVTHCFTCSETRFLNTAPIDTLWCYTHVWTQYTDAQLVFAYTHFHRMINVSLLHTLTHRPQQASGWTQFIK